MILIVEGIGFTGVYGAGHQHPLRPGLYPMTTFEPDLGFATVAVPKPVGSDNEQVSVYVDLTDSRVRTCTDQPSEATTALLISAEAAAVSVADFERELCRSGRYTPVAREYDAWRHLRHDSATFAAELSRAALLHPANDGPDGDGLREVAAEMGCDWFSGGALVFATAMRTLFGRGDVKAIAANRTSMGKPMAIHYVLEVSSLFDGYGTARQVFDPLGMWWPTQALVDYLTVHTTRAGWSGAFLADVDAVDRGDHRDDPALSDQVAVHLAGLLGCTVPDLQTVTR